MLEIGSVVGGIYKILNVIGKGGMSVVYLAMNEKANKQWAIKEVRKDGIENFEVVKQGLVVEYVPEYAKELVWEENFSRCSSSSPSSHINTSVFSPSLKRSSSSVP